MAYKRYTMQQKWVNNEPQDEYRQGSLIDQTEYDTMSECNEGNQNPDIDIEGKIYEWRQTSSVMCYNYSKYYVEEKYVSNDNGATFVSTYETRRGQLIEQNTQDCGYIEPQTRWTTVQDEYVCQGADKYTKEVQEVSYDGGETWNTNGQERGGTLIQRNSIDCGWIPAPQFRWVDDGYDCVGFDKYAQEKEQVSLDAGETWSDTGETRLGELIEANSENCGYVPPTPEPEYRMVVVQGEYECVGYDKYTKLKKQVSYDSGETWEDVIPLYTEPGTLIETNSENCGYVPPSGSGDYLTFTMLEDGKITVWSPTNKNVYQYSLDEGETWKSLPITSMQDNKYFSTISTVTAGNKIMWKATNLSRYVNGGIGTFSSSGRFDVSGNIMSLLYGDNFVSQTNLTGKSYAFNTLFKNCTRLVNAKDLVLPATTLANYCYADMFYGCSRLTTAPVLPATTLANYCYQNMFRGCTSLTTATALPATTLANYCYERMFYGCTSLTTASALPATTLTQYCYSHMFYGCTSLTTAPQLSATTLAEYCCVSMFNGCTSLVNAPELPATTLGERCYYSMFQGCTSLVNVPSVLPATTLANGCYYVMFEGCTSLVNAPTLPATTLGEECYRYMFRYCTSLTTAPQLSATTLDYMCYSGMFEGCTSLTTAPALPATTLANWCYANMFYACSALTTAPALPATTLADYCYNSMFLECTSLTTAPELPATTLVEGCYGAMFSRCTRLKYIKAMFTTTPSDTYTNNWVYWVPREGGTFVKNSAATWNVTGNNGIPSGWTVETASS